MSELSEASKEMWLTWWANRTPEDRAALKGMHGKDVTLHRNELVADDEGVLPAVLVPVGENAVFVLPDCLMQEDDRD